MRFYQLKLNLSGKGRKCAKVAGPSKGYFTKSGSRNQENISPLKFAEDQAVLFDELIFSGGKGAVITDFIWHPGIGGKGFVITERVKEIFDNFNLPAHKYYKLPSYEDGRKRKHQFYKLQLLLYPYDYAFLDFNKSSFYFGDFFKKNKAIVKFREEGELVTRLKNLDKLKEKIWVHQIALNSTFKQLNLDCFYMHQLSKQFLISEALRNALIDGKVTGIAFEDSAFSLGES